MVIGLKAFIAVARVVFIAAIVLVGITSVFSYLAVTIAEEPTCAAHEWPMGHRLRDLAVLPFFAIILAALAGGMCLERVLKMGRLFDVYATPIFEFASIEVTFDMVVAYGTLLSFLLMSVITAGISITHYLVIAPQCAAAIAPKLTSSGFTALAGC
jgi:hypothetical protein